MFWVCCSTWPFDWMLKAVTMKFFCWQRYNSALRSFSALFSSILVRTSDEIWAGYGLTSWPRILFTFFQTGHITAGCDFLWCRDLLWTITTIKVPSCVFNTVWCSNSSGWSIYISMTGDCQVSKKNSNFFWFSMQSLAVWITWVNFYANILCQMGPVVVLTHGVVPLSFYRVTHDSLVTCLLQFQFV